MRPRKQTFVWIWYIHMSARYLMYNKKTLCLLPFLFCCFGCFIAFVSRKVNIFQQKVIDQKGITTKCRLTRKKSTEKSHTQDWLCQIERWMICVLEICFLSQQRNLVENPTENSLEIQLKPACKQINYYRSVLLTWLNMSIAIINRLICMQAIQIISNYMLNVTIWFWYFECTEFDFKLMGDRCIIICLCCDMQFTWLWFMVH